MAATHHVSRSSKALRVLLNSYFHTDLPRRMATIPTGRTEDPTVPTEDPEEVQTVDAIMEQSLNPKGIKTENQAVSGGSVHNLSPVTKSPIPSSPKVESIGVNTPINPRTQQKREFQG